MMQAVCEVGADVYEQLVQSVMDFVDALRL